VTVVVGGRFGGKVSPAALLADALGLAESMEQCVIICLDKETGDISVGYSTDSLLKSIGLCEAAKDALLDKL
jgi:hypothetical protein